MTNQLKSKIWPTGLTILPASTLLATARAWAIAKCQGVNISIDVNCTKTDNPIWSYAAGIIKFLGAGVGLVVLLMLIIGGIQYITSSGNPQALEGAKKRIANAIIALLLFIFMASILNFLIPGGIL